MTVNKYFQTGTQPGIVSEQNLVEDTIIEMIQAAGHDCLYIPRSHFSPDKFYREIPFDKFEDYFQIEMYMNNVTDWNGQGNMMSKFGLQIDDTAEFMISIRRFTEVTGMDHPRSGDLIYFPMTKYLMQIDFVEDEPGNMSMLNQFHVLSKLYTYCLKCSLYQYSYEQFSTGFEEIDTALDIDTYNDKLTDFDFDVINDEASDILDFTEDNPFGKTVE